MGVRRVAGGETTSGRVDEIGLPVFRGVESTWLSTVGSTVSAIAYAPANTRGPDGVGYRTAKLTNGARPTSISEIRDAAASVAAKAP